MEQTFADLTHQMDHHPGASEVVLAELQDEAGVTLPADHLAFLRWSNGAEGRLGPNEVRIWTADSVALDPYRINEYAEWLLFFAAAGDTWFGFDTRSEPMPILAVATFASNPDTLEPVAHSFRELLACLATYDLTEDAPTG